MPSQEQLQAIDDGLVRRAEHYLRLSEWLNQSDEEAVETWRQDVADCVQVAHDVFQCLDPQYETSTLKEVAYRQYNETSGAVVISKKSIMLWRIPGSLHSFSASYIGADGVLYVTPTKGSLCIEKPAREMEVKDMLFLEHVLSEFFETNQSILTDDGFDELFNEK